MNKHDYFRLADDGCPHCEEHWKPLAWNQDQKRKSSRTFCETSPPIYGPRFCRFFLTTHCRERWAERFPHLPADDLAHVVRFSRVIAHTICGGSLALWYECEAVYIPTVRIGRAGSRDFAVLTVVPTWMLSAKKDVELVTRWRVKMGLCVRSTESTDMSAATHADRHASQLASPALRTSSGIESSRLAS